MLSPRYLLWFCQSLVWAQWPSHAMYQLFLWQMGKRCVCVLANLEYLSILFCAVFWAAAPGLVAVLPMWDSAYVSGIVMSSLSILSEVLQRHSEYMCANRPSLCEFSGSKIFDKTFKHCDIILCVYTFLVNVNVPNTLHAFYCIFLQLYSCSCYLSALPQVINTA